MHALEMCVFSVGFSFGYKDIYIYLKSCCMCYSNPLCIFSKLVSKRGVKFSHYDSKFVNFIL